MRKVLGERGAINVYIIGVAFLAVVIIGGVFLLRNFNTQKVTDETETIQTDSAGNQEDEKNGETENEPSANENETGNENNNNPAQNPAPDHQAGKPADPTEELEKYKPSTLPSDPAPLPEDVPATGPSDTIAVIITPLLIMGAIYAMWNYRLARVAMKKSMLKTTE